MEEGGNQADFLVKPFIWRAFKGSVVKVEPIDVNGSSHLPMPHKKSRGRRSDPAPQVETMGVVSGSNNTLNLIHMSRKSQGVQGCKEKQVFWRGL